MKCVTDIVGSRYVGNGSVEALAIIDDVYKSVYEKSDPEEQRKIDECTNAVIGIRNSQGRSVQMGEKKARELMVHLGIWLTQLSKGDFDEVCRVRRWKTRTP